MRALMMAAGAAGLSLALPAMAAAATADTSSVFAPTTIYGSLGYAGGREDGVDLGAIQGRLGARFGKYVGVEGELAGGVKGDDVTVGGTDVHMKLRSQEAAYGVGYLPVTPRLDLIGRVGYGHADIKASAAGVAQNGGADSWNYGAGAQYSLDDKNGVRADYTRQDFQHGPAKADVWSLAYVRKF